MIRGELILVYIKLLLTAIFWGGTFIAARLLADHVGPFSAAFLRFAVASALLLLLTWKSEGKLPGVSRHQVIPLILIGMTGVFAYNVFFFKGLKLISAGRASLIIANNPVFITIFAILLFKERLTFLKMCGVALSATGAVIVISRGRLGDMVGGGFGWGEFYIFCCVASWVAYSLIGKAVMSKTGLSPLVSTSYASVVGAVALFIPACLEGVVPGLFSYSLVDWACIFYLGFFGTVLGFVWYYEGINAIGPTKAGQFINFVPISAILMAFLIIDEPITLSLLIGGLLIITGVSLTNMQTGCFRKLLTARRVIDT